MAVRRRRTSRGQIRTTLIRNYAWIFLIIVIAFAASVAGFIYLMKDPHQLWGEQWSSGKNSELVMFVKQEANNGLTAADLIAEGNEPDASRITALGGWVEVLDESNNIVQIIGEKQTGEQAYTQEQLYRLLANPSDSPYYYTIAPIDRAGSAAASLIAALPRDAIVHHLVPSALSADPFVTVTVNALLAGILFFLLLAFLIFIFGRWTAERMARPFYQITEGIQQMTRGHLDTRLVFEAEQELEQIRDAFNFMVVRLEQSEREKQELEADKRRMIVDISHDLKTPITTIHGCAQALRDGLLQDEEKKMSYIEVIHDKSLRVADLIDRLSELAELERPAFVIRKRTEDCGELVRRLVAEHYAELEDKQFELKLDVPDEPSMIKADRVQLTRALSNLLQNALKYNPPGTTLAVRLEDRHDQVIVTIADNGIGIDEELKRGLFEPFVRGDRARSSTGGLGLGLAIAKTIVEKHGGRLELLEAPGMKTAFAITLPK